MTINQYLKFIRKVVSGKDKYYPKDLIPHLTNSDPNCENCKKMVAENLAIQLNILNHGGQYRPGATVTRTNEPN